MSQSAINYPRYRVTMNGAAMPGVEHCEIVPALAYQIGTFRIEKAFFPGDPYPFSWWASTKTKDMQIVVQVSVDGNTFTTAFTGNVDSHSYDVVSNKITIVGRDLASKLADQRTFSTLPNQTASEMATTIAQQNGLIADVTPTKRIIGRYYDADYAQTQSGDGNSASNLWDLLCKIGSGDGVVPYVFGNTLYFNPQASSPAILSAYFNRDSRGGVIANIEGMTLERHLTYARDVVVTVTSWHSKKKASASATVRTKTKDVSNTAATDPPSRFYVQKPNLTQAQCLALAQQLALDYSQHERSVTVQAASLLLMPPVYIVQISGTGTDYDTTYAPSTTSYAIDFERGATTTINAKTSSPVGLYDDDSGEQIGESA
jgi:hypothetical protein